MKYLKDILGKAIYEDDHNEFKQRLGDDISSLLKEIAAFANSGGGNIYLGVKDDGEACGFLFPELDPIINRVKNEAKQFLKPRVTINPEFLEYEEGEGQRYVLRLAILPNKELPVFFYRGSSAVYVRSYSQTILAEPDEILALFRLSERHTYDDLATEEIYEPSNFKSLFDSYRNNRNEELTDHRLESLPFYDDGRHLYKGSVLFSDGFKGDETFIMVTRYQSSDKSGDLIQKLYEGSGNIIEMIDKITGIIEQSTFVGLKKEEIGNIELRSYPARAVTEAIVNAYAHKDYSIEKGIIEVNIFSDRLEVTSPGGLVGAERLYKEKNLLAIAPKRRNPKICAVLTMLGLMESAGSGFSKIADSYKDADNHHQPYVNSSLSSFSLILPDLVNEHGLVEDENPTLSLVYSPKSGAKYEERILRYCYFVERSISEIAEVLSLQVSSHLRNDILAPLVERGLLLSFNEKNRILYRTSREAVKIV